jgi:hypothetical protein
MQRAEAPANTSLQRVQPLYSLYGPPLHVDSLLHRSPQPKILYVAQVLWYCRLSLLCSNSLVLRRAPSILRVEHRRSVRGAESAGCSHRKDIIVVVWVEHVFVFVGIFTH